MRTRKAARRDSTEVGLSICSKKHSRHGAEGRPLNMHEDAFKALRCGLSICLGSNQGTELKVGLSMCSREQTRHLMVGLSRCLGAVEALYQ